MGPLKSQRDRHCYQADNRFKEPMRRVFLALAALMLLADAPDASGQSVDFSSRELSLGGELQQVINSKRLQLGQPELQSLTNELEEAQLIYSDAVLEKPMSNAFLWFCTS